MTGRAALAASVLGSDDRCSDDTSVPLPDAVASVPPGRWAVGVSGGADSVALLRLLRQRNDLTLHVVHLDHQTRGDASTADATFVADLAKQLNVTCTIARRADVERDIAHLPRNASARYRAARFALFRGEVESKKLDGVILAHHADDHAETILHRLLRGAGSTALAGMSPRATVSGVRVLRPLLKIPGADLRQYLRDIGQPWREDASNTSPRYLRNRLRPILAADPTLRDSLLALGERCARWKRWITTNAPRLENEFPVAELADCPPALARHAAARWLIARGAPPDQISQSVSDRLLEMATDAASPPRQHFPGALLVRRRRGVIFVESG
jgi:tRNA(Ile)-lysidine synthase